MILPAYYQSDLAVFFENTPQLLPLYQQIFAFLDRAFPDGAVKVQKSQISFYNRHLFAMISLPRKKSQSGLLLSFGLDHRLASPRVAMAVQPYPNRWTHHVPILYAEQLDEELRRWLEEAYTFAQEK